MFRDIKRKIKSIRYVGDFVVFFYRFITNPERIIFVFLNSLFFLISLFSFNVKVISYFYSFFKSHGTRYPHHLCRYISLKRSRMKLKERCDFFKGKKIAIIGNATSLLDKKYGQLIDDHDVVIRINRANIVNEVSQGSKTTVWATSFKYENTLEKYDFIIWLTPFFHSELCYPSKSMIDDGVLIYPFSDWSSLKNNINSYPTSGLMLLDFIMKYTDYNSISMFGFDFFKTPNHYENKIFSKHKFHDFNNEEFYVKEIIKNKENRVELYV